MYSLLYANHPPPPQKKTKGQTTTPVSAAMEALNWVNVTLESLPPGPATKLVEYYKARPPVFLLDVVCVYVVVVCMGVDQVRKGMLPL